MPFSHTQSDLDCSPDNNPRPMLGYVL